MPPASQPAAPAPEPKTKEELAEERHEKLMLIIDITAAVVLGAGTVLSSVAAWQGDLWGGQALLTNQQAVTMSNEAQAAAMQGLQFMMMDGIVFMEFLSQAKLGEDQKDASRLALAAYLEKEMMFDDFKVALAWAKQQNGISPFNFPGLEEGTPEHEKMMETLPALKDTSVPDYQHMRLGAAMSTKKKADALFEQANEEDERGDDFMYTTLFYTVGLFFAGLAAAMPRLPIKIAMVALGTIMIIYGVVQMMGLEFM